MTDNLDDLRTRIAKVITDVATAITDALADQKHWQGELSPHDLADAVIRELGLSEGETGR